MKKHALLLFAVALVLSVAPCLATSINFANFHNLGTLDVQMLYAAGVNTLEVLDKPVVFNYYGVTVPVALQGDLAAHLTFTASSSTPATNIGLAINQLNYQGSFVITLDTPYNGKDILLGGTFGPFNSDLTGFGTFAITGDATSPAHEDISFYSDFIAFNQVPVYAEALGISMSNVTPGMSLNAAMFINAFTAAETGTFSADIIPEPFSFLLLGSGLVGLGLLRRKLR